MSKAKKTIRKVEELVDYQLISPTSQSDLETVAEQFSIAIPPNLYEAMDLTNPADPLKRQFVPSNEELMVTLGERDDPIGDDLHTTVKGIIHRYPDRCLFKPVNVCPVYCRFCFRREKVGPGGEVLSGTELEQAYDYIRSHPDIWEVILTGGDPLILKPKVLSTILKALEAIETVEVIRIHTRVPIADPKRINSAMVRVLSLISKPIYIAVHANHSNEFTSDTKKAVASLASAGIPLLGQSVLLRGVNDDIQTLIQLMRTMVKNRIKPYYLHQGDMARGTHHFRTSIAKGQALMKKMRGYSGICQPLYVLDIPGGYGKVPIHSNYLTNDEQGHYRIEDYQGRWHDYCDSHLHCPEG